MALRENRDADAAEVAQSLLIEYPERVDVLQTLAFALHRLGRLDESLEHYLTLARLEPKSPTWPSMVRTLRGEIRARSSPSTGARDLLPGSWDEDMSGTVATVGRAKPAPLPASVASSEPGWSWSSFAAEFLEEHWQKLILCLAVLLIVVSSTVGRICCWATSCGGRRASARWRWCGRSRSPRWAPG